MRPGGGSRSARSLSGVIRRRQVRAVSSFRPETGIRPLTSADARRFSPLVALVGNPAAVREFVYRVRENAFW
ncbi:hypothetical protein JOF53_007915 [Crossiella equi]|uniref:Uncharacterized protein n=1 Tax=Crossiella equi TaxID=130796 RepID=A0ABS5AR58_9PSEU|nr:hypothetical protein [Crossiella equi]